MTQEKALSILKTGANVFLTGEPGSGKTHSVNRFVEYLREHDIEPAITASTGIAATHIGGMTIHSWSGIGIKKVLLEEDLDKLGTNERLSKRVSRAKVLIIDEISMLDSMTLSAVDMACKTLRRSDEPFGGLQVVFVGDFFQLPPVSRFGEAPSQFAFLSPAWQEAKPLVCYLSEQHRHEDAEFIKFLSAVRSGKVNEESHRALSSRKVEPKGSLAHTRLYSHNIDVDKVNNEKITALSGDAHTFKMETFGREGLVLSLKKGCLSPETLHLKIGARVMFTKNSFEHGFVNGTLGEVESFSDTGGPIVRTKRGGRIAVDSMEWTITDGSRTMAKIIQIPLRLAWAITVHKSQGMTLDAVVIDLSEAFEYGQGYVALSRVRAFSGLFLLGYNERALEVHPGILSADSQFKETSEGAEVAFEKIPPEERAKMELNFIRACGGKVEKVTPRKKTVRSPSTKLRGQTTYDATLLLWKQGKAVEEIASLRGVVRGTIVSHLSELYMRKAIDKDELTKVISAPATRDLPNILVVFKELGTEKLSPVFEKLSKKYSYDDLRLIRLLYT